MSLKETVEARCPSCGEEFSTTVWRSMNVTEDPDAKELLLGGSVNVFQCPRCRYESMLDIDFLYHDMEGKFCVQYYPYERLSDDGFLANFTTDAEPAIVVPDGMQVKPGMEYLTHPHIVFEMGELVRYVAFRDRLYEIGCPQPGSGKPD